MDALERFRQLAAWLADTDIAVLELSGPLTRLRLVRGTSGEAALQGAGVDLPAQRTPQTSPGATVVPASGVGIVRLRHPLRDAPLAPVGASVSCAQVLALLQVGPVLVHVAAPRNGVVASLRARDGDAVGYGDPLIEMVD
ncbi:biotin/lipoyl-containing protein [Piscinibacter sp. XHJ-5]|uniref:acetyl-CoA carboxylase biotin carboxyl carrier protein n=1 Tax=Piscinibacter sp. XHJ-5 TaxID=3037797 RepID=UPI0024532D86|nr:biotin/lipoyl-containing protein [Piscinibacter sp. XHJ-5]